MSKYDSVTVTVRMPAGLKARLDRAVEQANEGGGPGRVTLNSLCLYALERGLDGVFCGDAGDAIPREQARSR